jgi:hypothetical protein
MLHKRLIDAYGAQCKDDWPSGSKDGYFSSIWLIT